ncbi:hypothetical protein [Apilactobacillus timberlakei]|uniref:Uncharacterized protein n=1 Tax=Apilactobacillus timberlakei TaxID=2008380 RepID=A0ABY2YRD9_9LACO|nr:hypothetical protein [Apilactobacillus timberlakei]TPR12423.1 hypothetical protein DY048_07685 [Apilactobacillus timberlakei]TPR12963.1 hypothetical protein DY052_08605 [Apilactobacillus timberlakei]
MTNNKSDFVVYFYDEAKNKNYVHYQNKRMYTNPNPKLAWEVNHNQAVSILAKRGQQFGGGFENHATAYANYVVDNQIPADQI